MKKQKVTIFLYNRLFDPVIQSNFWLYIDELVASSTNPAVFALISYEDSNFPLTVVQQEKIKKWESQGLKWEKLSWHSGLSISAKIIDVWFGFWCVLKLYLTGYTRIISVASLAGGLIYLYSRLLPLKRYSYCFEPHSEYALDNGIWTGNSKAFKILNFLEKKSAKKAKVISSGTRFMEERIRETWKYNYPIFIKIPTVVDDQKFKFSPSDRIKIRTEIGITNETKLLFYPGKFGDLYYKEEIPKMFKWLDSKIENLHFLIVTPNPPQEVHKLFTDEGIEVSKFTITQSGYENIHTYFSAADFGIVAVPPGPSKKFISNIKVGEYLCSGLPYLITNGVSEDYIYATEKQVGVVVDDFTESEIKRVAAGISSFLSADREALRIHCREVGVEYRGLSSLSAKFRAALLKLIE